jgi:hypothetical protein
MTVIHTSKLKFIIDLQTKTIGIYLNTDKGYKLVDALTFTDIIPFIKEMLKLLL